MEVLTTKLITAIVNKEDSKNVCNELIKVKFYVTRLATTGGFLMAGNMTLLIGTEDERVDDCIRADLLAAANSAPRSFPAPLPSALGWKPLCPLR